MPQTMTPPVGSPLWWVARLEAKLEKRRSKLTTYDDYYEGNHPLGFASAKFRTAFGGLFEEFADNWCDLVVDAVEERLDIEGFRLGEDQEKGDRDAWDIWQRNQLDAESQIGHTEALLNGEAAVIVWADTDGQPIITVEHPSQVVVEMIGGSRRDRVAALKRWSDDSGGPVRQYATLYLPNEIWKFQSPSPVSETGVQPINPHLDWMKAAGWQGGTTQWEPRELSGEAWPLKNPLGVVPVVPLENRPRLLKPGVSEIHKVIPVQDGVNKLVADMLVASEYAAFRQRWVTGMDIPKDPETGQEIEAFRPAIDRMFHGENAETKFGEFDVTQLQNFVVGIEMLIQHIASQTRTPPHYFYLKGQFPSGESIKSAETGLVAKSRRKMRHFGEAWEEVIRLAFLVLDDPRGKITDSEVIWGDPEFRSEAEHMDALVKKMSIGVPQQQLWEDAGYTPQQIERFKTMLIEMPTPALNPVIPTELVP